MKILSLYTMEFREYLTNKMIDADKFVGNEPGLYKRLKDLFLQMHPKSFTLQKLYLINPIRRRFPLPLELKGDKKKNIAQRPVVKKPESQSSKPVTGESPRIKPKIPGSKPARPKIIPKQTEGNVSHSNTKDGSSDNRAKRPVIKKSSKSVKPVIPKKDNQNSEKKPGRPKPVIKKRKEE